MNWKAVAIIFIILFVLETIGFLWIMNLGRKQIELETECSYNICGDDYYDAYYFDFYENICYCYANDEIVHQEYLK